VAKKEQKAKFLEILTAPPIFYIPNSMFFSRGLQIAQTCRILVPARMEKIKETFEAVETQALPEEAQLSPEESALLREMMEAGLFYGRTKSRTHPKMRPFVSGTRNNFHVIDLVKTMTALGTATKIIREKVENGKAVLFVGTTSVAKGAIAEIAKELAMPSVTVRWLGGTLTNFKVITERINHFKKLKNEKASGGLEKYTKKERVVINREIERLERMFSGIEGMNELPGLLFVIDAKASETAIREAKKMGIPVVAVMNTESDPNSVDYPVPANDRSEKGIHWLVNYFERTIREARQEAMKRKEVKTQTPEKKPER